MQLATKDSPNQILTQAKRLLVAVCRFLNQKWLLWAFIIWLSFDINITANSFSIKFSKPVCAKVNGLFIATKGGK